MFSCDIEDLFKNYFASIICYADAGIGKTTAAATIEGNKIFVCVENGMQSLSKLPKEVLKQIKKVIFVRTAEDAYQLVKDLNDGKYDHLKIEWLIVDSISELCSLLKKELSTKYKNNMQLYPKIEEFICSFIRELVELPLHKFFIAKEFREQVQISDDKSIDKFNLLLDGQKLTAQIPHLVDEVWRLTAKGEKRILITKNDGRTRAKSRNWLPSEIDVSDGIGDLIKQLLASDPVENEQSSQLSDSSSDNKED